MKHFFFSVALLGFLAGFSSFAAETNVPNVLQSFYHTFKKAENVNWTKVDDMMRIGFTLNGQEHFAYYEEDKLVVLAKEIQLSELPARLQDPLTKYHGYSITKAYELNKEGTREYYLVLDNGTQHLVLNGTKKWRPFLKNK